MHRVILLTLFIIPISVLSQIHCAKYTKEYIPVDLQEAISFFECNWSEENLVKFKNKEEKIAISELHFQTGLWIRNNWGLWGRTSKLSKFFEELGIYQPDDISAIIFTSLYRKLNSKPINLEGQVKLHKDYWVELEKREKEKEVKEFSVYKIGDKVEFSYEYDYISKRQENKWWDDTCIATAIIEDLNYDNYELKIRLLESCDRRGIIILKYDVLEKNNGKFVKIEEDKTEIMKEGEIRWSSYKIWNLLP